MVRRCGGEVAGDAGASRGYAGGMQVVGGMIMPGFRSCMQGARCLRLALGGQWHTAHASGMQVIPRLGPGLQSAADSCAGSRASRIYKIFSQI